MSEVSDKCINCVSNELCPERMGKTYKCPGPIPYRFSKPDGTANAQKHYQVADKQPIEIMQEYLTQEQFIGLMRGQVLKYTLRFGHKDDTTKEADKIYQYAKWLRQAVRGEKINPRREAELEDERKWSELG